MGRNKKPFSGQPAETPDQIGWAKVQAIEISFGEFYHYNPKERPAVPLAELAAEYDKKLEQIEFNLSAVRERMEYLRGLAKTKSTDWNFRLAIMENKKDPSKRAPSLRWRPRSTTGGRKHWVDWTDWPQQLASTNLSTEWRDWYMTMSEIAIVLNSQAVLLHTARRVVTNDLVSIRLLLGVPVGESKTPTT